MVFDKCYHDIVLGFFFLYKDTCTYDYMIFKLSSSHLESLAHNARLAFCRIGERYVYEKTIYVHNGPRNPTLRTWRSWRLLAAVCILGTHQCRPSVLEIEDV